MSAPKLRFKEFDGDWKESRLKDLAVKITDGTHDTPVVQKEGIPFLTAINVKDGFINYDDIGYVDEITHKKIYERCNPEKDDLLIVNIGAGTATCARNIVDYQFSLKNVALVKPNKILLNPIFLEQIQRKNSSKLFTSLTSGGAQPFLSLKEIGNLLIKYPLLEEQTKIASFLSAVDEKISQLTQKHELLSQYKQGMMQKLFSQQIRFKADDGSEFGEWEEVELAGVSDVRDGTHDSPAYHLTGFPLITSKNLKNGKLDLTDINYISAVDFESINRRSKVDIGDIIFGMIGTIGNPVLLESDGFAIKNVALIKEKSELLNIYLIQYLSTSLFFKQVNLLNAGNTQKFLALGQIRSLKILKPCLEEQTKLAHFLSSIDQKIEVVAQQIEQAKQWKKGLLQQMFV